jgi:hypothetical protein
MGTWLIAGLVLAVLVILAVARRRAGTRARPADKKKTADPYVCDVCDDRDCSCEKPGRRPPAN